MSNCIDGVMAASAHLRKHGVDVRSFQGRPDIYMTNNDFARLHPYDRGNVGIDQIPLTQLVRLLPSLRKSRKT